MSAYSLGTILGGVASGLVLVLANTAVAGVTLDVRALVWTLLAGGLLMFGARPQVFRLLPQRRALVPAAVAERRTLAAWCRFGAEMGSGVRTFVTSIAPYVLVTWLILLAPGPLVVVLAAGAFGASRCIHTWIVVWPRSGRDSLRASVSLDRVAQRFAGPLCAAFLAIATVPGR